MKDLNFQEFFGYIENYEWQNALDWIAGALTAMFNELLVLIGAAEEA